MDLDLKIISATDIKKFNLFTAKIHPYVVVSISGATQKTPVDGDGDRNPTWNHPLTFSVPIGCESDLIVMFQIRSRRSISADKLIGEVCVPLRDLVESVSGGKTPAPANFVSYQVRKPSGKAKGVLTFSYRLTGKISGIAVPEDPVISYPAKPQATCAVYPAPAPMGLYPPMPKPKPVTGYPAVEGYKHDVYPPPVQTSYGYPEQSGYGHGYPKVDGYKYDVYPPPAATTAAQTSYGYPTQSGYEYGYPAQIGYGYPGQAGYGYGSYGSGYGYGYGGQVVQPSVKRNNGLGLGVGLLGGVVAGLLVGDLV